MPSTLETQPSQTPSFEPEAMKVVTNWWVETAPQLGDSNESDGDSHMQKLQDSLTELKISESGDIAELVMQGKYLLDAAATFHRDIPDTLGESEKPHELKSRWEKFCDEKDVAIENRQLLWEQGRQWLMQQTTNKVEEE